MKKTKTRTTRDKARARLVTVTLLSHVLRVRRLRVLDELGLDDVVPPR